MTGNDNTLQYVTLQYVTVRGILHIFRLENILRINPVRDSTNPFLRIKCTMRFIQLRGQGPQRILSLVPC